MARRGWEKGPLCRKRGGVGKQRWWARSYDRSFLATLLCGPQTPWDSVSGTQRCVGTVMDALDLPRAGQGSDRRCGGLHSSVRKKIDELRL